MIMIINVTLKCIHKIKIIQVASERLYYYVCSEKLGLSYGVWGGREGRGGYIIENYLYCVTTLCQVKDIL